MAPFDAALQGLLEIGVLNAPRVGAPPLCVWPNGISLGRLPCDWSVPPYQTPARL